MRILVLSDLHLELGHAFVVPKGLDYDVVVLAGDIHAPGSRDVDWAKRHDTFGGRPVIIVRGNHEFCGTTMHIELAHMREATADTNVHLLARDTSVIDGVRFIGYIPWTDFELPIRVSQDGAVTTDVARALKAAAGGMNDYSRIRIEDEREMPTWDGSRLLTADDTLAMHQRNRAWLQRELTKPFDGPTVVVTHHGPSTGSVAKRYAADWCTPAFVSDLPDEFFAVPTLWVHGHTHTRFDYQRGDCRVVSEPRGYRIRDGSLENHLFDGRLVVDVAHGEAGNG